MDLCNGGMVTNSTMLGQYRGRSLTGRLVDHFILEIKLLVFPKIFVEIVAHFRLPNQCPVEHIK